MPTVCVVKGCRKYQRKGISCKFFTLPWKNDALCREWLRLAGRHEDMGAESTLRFKRWKMCSLHFEDKHQARKGLPTLYLPGFEQHQPAAIESRALTQNLPVQEVAVLQQERQITKTSPYLKQEVHVQPVSAGSPTLPGDHLTKEFSTSEEHDQICDNRDYFASQPEDYHVLQSMGSTVQLAANFLETMRKICASLEKNGYQSLVVIASSQDIHTEMGSERGRLFIERFDLMKRFLSFCKDGSVHQTMSSQSTGMDTDGEELNIGRNGMCDSKQFLNLNNGEGTDKIKTETGTNFVQIENVVTGMATTMTASYPARFQVPHPEVKVEQRPEVNLVPHYEINQIFHSKPKLALHHETKLTAIPKRKLLPHAEQPLVPRPEIKLVTHVESKQQLQFDMKLVRPSETNHESKQSGNKRRKLMLNPEVKQIPCPIVQQQSQSEISRIKFSENKQITQSENGIVHPKINYAIHPWNNTVSYSVNNHVPLPEERVATSARYKQVPTCEQLYPDKKQLSPYIRTVVEVGAEIKQKLSHDIEKLPPCGIKHIQFAESKTSPHPVLLVTYDKGKQVTCRATHQRLKTGQRDETNT